MNKAKRQKNQPFSFWVSHADISRSPEKGSGCNTLVLTLERKYSLPDFMARKPRIEFPGALYHVIARGNQRSRIFLNDDDCRDYLNRLWKYHDKFDFIIYAYCLMSNHLHLLIEAGDIPLSRIMQRIQFSYTQSFNRRHKKVGHLFQGRYKSILCNKDEYLLQLIRYIHLNPVRARMVKDPKEYMWSSHRAILGVDRDRRCDAERVLKLFGKSKKTAIKKYEAFVLSEIDSGHKDEFYSVKDQRILGEDEFAQEIVLQKEKGEKLSKYYEISVKEIITAVSKEWGIAVSEICSRRNSRQGSFGREVVSCLAKNLTGISMKELGHYFHKGEAGMSHRWRAIEDKLEKNDVLRKRVYQVSAALTSGRKIKIV